MNVLTVVGARPQFIKAAVVSRVMRSISGQVDEILVHTGQHYDQNMSDIFFKDLDIPEPAYNLGVGGGSHGQNTGRMLEGLEKLMLDEKPDWVLVYGDTDSTLAGALAAAKLHIPIAHVEAGLRSFNRRMPEEVNRVLTDHVSTILFAPTILAQKNLLNEGIKSSLIDVVGDVMLDAALFYRKNARKPVFFDRLSIESGKFVLCTIHRAENTDSTDRMRQILQGLATSDLPIVLPLHPRTKARLLDNGLSMPSNVVVVDPVGYLEMVWLEANCTVIATDSGGVQKEAYFHEKGCVTLRDETEWVELVEGGYNRIVGCDALKIETGLAEMRSIRFEGGQLYGDGRAGEKIVQALLNNNIVS